MKSIIIEGTKYSPRIELHPHGQMSFAGRSLIEDPVTFYKPVFQWIREQSFELLNIEIKLEYINTSSTKQIFSLITEINDHSGIKNMHIDWYYEEDDEDSLELGKEIESLMDIPFDFYKFPEVAA